MVAARLLSGGREEVAASSLDLEHKTSAPSFMPTTKLNRSRISSDDTGKGEPAVFLQAGRCATQWVFQPLLPLIAYDGRWRSGSSRARLPAATACRSVDLIFHRLLGGPDSRHGIFLKQLPRIKTGIVHNHAHITRHHFFPGLFAEKDISVRIGIVFIVRRVVEVRIDS